MNINKIVIWGHQLNDHTHSYIHNAFYKSFKYMGYKTYWFSDNIENILKIDFNNSLFIVHGLVSINLPVNETSIYITHNTELKNEGGKITFVKSINQNQIPVQNILNLQVYTKDCINRDLEDTNNKCHFYMEPPNQIIYFPWATDLLPYEVDNIINKLNFIESSNEINFIGMMSECWHPVKDYCLKNNIKFNHYGGTFNINSDRNKSIEENVGLIQKSITGLTIVSDWQKDVGYIPCRIFKNLSYGKMGATNSKAIYEFFDKKIIYSENIVELLDEAIKFEKNLNKNKIVKELMENIRDNHTYINRCNYILDYLYKYLNIEIEI